MDGSIQLSLKERKALFSHYPQSTDPAGRLWGDRHIHVIGDNARCHDCLVDQFLCRWVRRITIHCRPKYAPETYPIERVRRHFQKETTCNHRCQSNEELVNRAFAWFSHNNTFEIVTFICPLALAA